MALTSILKTTKCSFTFQNKKILNEAFTHCSISKESNYERLEFLGDSVVDIIVVSNMIKMGDFTADNLTVFRHMIVNNNVLSKFSISMGLNNYLKASKEIYSEIDSHLRNLVWEEDILTFGCYNSDPPKHLNDIFESC